MCTDGWWVVHHDPSEFIYLVFIGGEHRFLPWKQKNAVNLIDYGTKRSSDFLYYLLFTPTENLPFVY